MRNGRGISFAVGGAEFSQPPTQILKVRFARSVLFFGADKFRRQFAHGAAAGARLEHFAKIVNCLGQRLVPRFQLFNASGRLDSQRACGKLDTLFALRGELEVLCVRVNLRLLSGTEEFAGSLSVGPVGHAKIQLGAIWVVVPGEAKGFLHLRTLTDC